MSVRLRPDPHFEDMNMNWYCCHGNEEITETNVLKETKKKLLITRREGCTPIWVKKASKIEIYFPTLDEAVDFWISKIKGEIIYHEWGIKYAKEKLEKFNKVGFLSSGV